MFSLLLTIIGVLALIKGATWLVFGASSVAKRFGVQEIIIGLTIVAFGTSMPELVVNISAAVTGATSLAFGNIIGSNIVNIGLVLGTAAVITPLAVNRNTLFKEIPLALASAVSVFILGMDILFAKSDINIISKGDGFILIMFFLIFLSYTYEVSNDNKNIEDESIPVLKTAKAIFFIVLGLIFLIGGGWMVVQGSTEFARLIGISEKVIGLTIVAIGTSLPELITSVVAAYKGSPGIAVGNAIGSNIFNVFWILGITSIINPVTIPDNGLLDLIINIFFTVLLLLFLFMGKYSVLQRFQGVLLIVFYIVYLIFLLVF